MFELESYTVEGFRALAETVEIPVRAPTILTGANDGGKTTALNALEFLLGGRKPVEADFTAVGPPAEGATEPLRVERILVTGTFSMDEATRREFGRGEVTIKLRRSIQPGEAPRYEVLDRVPVDEELRLLADRKLQDLRDICERRDITPEGKASAKASWLAPLERLASESEQIEEWAPAPAEIVKRLPRCLVFSSTAEPDPERQIAAALKVAFDQVLDDGRFIGPVREAEEKVRQRLSHEAGDLCKHIGMRCPELSEIVVLPDVAFSEGFRSVEVRTSRGSTAGVALEKSGAGRRRRVNLAVWEWVQKLLDTQPEQERSVVIAYDEPDTHLDYGNQRDLVTLIQSQCQRDGTRMMVATHSLNLIDRVSINDVVHLRLENEQTQVTRLLGEEHEATQEYLADISTAMGLRNSVLLHERCFIGVEGPTETQALPLLFRTATGMSLQSAGIALIAGNSNEGALRVAEFLQSQDRRLAFLVDADSAKGTTKKLFRKDKLDSIGIKSSQIHYVGTAELEDLFSDEQWVETANRNWPRDDGQQWTVSHMAPVHLGSKFSAALMNVFRGGSSQAPLRKPGYLVALVQGLGSPDEVPQQLRDAFEALISLASDA
ncbi:MAG TPA: TOPRIM nucleotidyl transferase/hydrolase domain-containing protein [Solirubrobacterales bacterium]|nr:TOPRIM nucleotidyl transferase/hydrolase domain-containing protein [Solirubrobacterales bacterium]